MPGITNRPKSFLRNLVWLTLAVYLSICGLMFAIQDHMIFKPQPLAEDSAGLERFAASQLHLQRDGRLLHGWLLNPERPNLLVYYGGNAEEVSTQLAALNDLDGYAALLVNYRGFGLSQGEPSADALVDDAGWILQQLDVARQFQRVVLLGRSLGTGIAMQMAAQHPVAGVVLATPYERLTAVAQGYYPWLPVSLLMQHELDSLAVVPDVQGPVLILAVEPDHVVPTHHARKLADALGGRARFHLVPGASHLNIDSAPEYWSRIRAFLSERAGAENVAGRGVRSGAS